MSDFGKCDNCRQALIEIDHYGERSASSAIDGAGAGAMLLELPDDDIDALRERVRRAKQAG